MKGVLIVGHGSRQKSMERTLIAVGEMVQTELPEMLIEIASMKFGQRDIPSALTALLERDADEIVVAPYFLFDGAHLHKDIPEIIATYRQAHPHVKIVTADSLGVDERLAVVLTDRIRKCL